jgi:hypothetical protein
MSARTSAGWYVARWVACLCCGLFLTSSSTSRLVNNILSHQDLVSSTTYCLVNYILSHQLHLVPSTISRHLVNSSSNKSLQQLLVTPSPTMSFDPIHDSLNHTDVSSMTSSSISHDVNGDDIGGDKGQSRLLTLPREIRDQIWTLVLHPTVIFSVDTRPLSVEHGDRLIRPGKEYSDRTEYIKSLIGFYFPKIRVDLPPGPLKCENVGFDIFGRDPNLLLANRQVYAEGKFILDKFRDTIRTGITGHMVPEKILSVKFLRVLAAHKFEFDCHPFEMYSFLETTSAAFLKNIRSIILGEYIVSEEDALTSDYSDTKLQLILDDAWDSDCQWAPDGVWECDTPDLLIDYYKFENSRV